ncbi:STY4851/ECs_5259 family protein [Pseudoalteromonas sp. SR45-4]|uniref:STY4851/ECs_5259 family protein n=1 Tax=Pseudoalteromonas sp. SR45-4 TaxID=2760929 RepID=UPI0015F8C35D|nr:STY4851/ECs_5259 family protein [Pseudoalteromonas sp. SR45-4]MBB1370646.1 hypothetical protein [Pseudoalteromonas sp. SR45-4]
MSISNISSKKLTGINALQHWESEFLSIAPRRRLLGKPIWAYKVTDEELTSLRFKLKGMLGGKSPSVVFNVSVIFDKLFVLYSTTWLQRNYSGGRDKWQPLFDSLGIKDYKPYYQSSIRATVKRGLESWQQIIFDTTRDEYFATLFCQGGFPRAILTGENETYLRQYLIYIIEEYSRFHLSKSSYELAKEFLPKLPKSLQQDSLAKLASTLVEDLILLRDEYHLYAVKDPVLVLEAKNPKWKKGLKFLLNDNEATELMRVLLRRAASIVKREKHPVRITRFLREGHEGWYLEALVHLNATINPDDLNDQLGNVNLPNFFDMYSLSSALDRKLSASFNLRADGAERWQVSRKAISYFGGSARNELSFELWSEDKKLTSNIYFRGEALSDVMPWVFAPASKGLMFIGEGSVKSQSEKVYIVSSVEPLPANLLSTVEYIAKIPGEERAVYEVYGIAKISTIHGSFKVITDCVSTNTVTCQIVGALEPLAVDEKVYKGLPTLVSNIDGSTSEISVEEIFWKSKESDKVCAWHADNVFGRGNILWVKDGDVAWQSNLNVIPKSSNFTHNLNGAGRLEVNVINFKNDGIALCHSQERWLKSVEPAIFGQRLNIQLPNSISASVSADLRWPYAGSLSFEIPTGQNGLCLISHTGRPITKYQRICIDDLYRCSLKVVCDNEKAIWGFKINAVLIKENKREQRDEVKVSLNEHLRFENEEISSEMLIDCQVLIKLANILYTQSDNTWDYISFRVENKFLDYRSDLGKVYPDRHLAIPINNERRVKEKFFISNIDAHKHPESVKLKLRPMWKLTESEVVMDVDYDELNRKAFVVPNDLQTGPWLVFADPEHKVQPTVVTIFGENVSFDGTLTCAVKSNNVRWFHDVLQLMVKDPNYKAWSEVELFVNALDLVRANTFNIFTHMLDYPQSFALLLFRKSDQEWFESVWKLQNQLPFSWLCLTLEHWLFAMDSLIARIDREVSNFSLNAEMIMQLKVMHIEDFLEKLSSRGEGFATIADILRYKKIGKTCEWINSHNDDWKLNQFDLFHKGKKELFDRQSGKFICRLQSARKDEEFRHELKPNLMRAVLPQKLHCLLINRNISEHIYKSQFFMLELPVLTAYWAAGHLDSIDDFPVNYKPFSRFLQVAISRLLSEDREWIHSSYSLALQASFLISKDNAHD